MVTSTLEGHPHTDNKATIGVNNNSVVPITTSNKYWGADTCGLGEIRGPIP